MNPNLFSRRVKETYHDFPEKRDSLEKIKRQRTLSSEVLSRFSPKHYPCIFLDQRLSSRFFR